MENNDEVGQSFVLDKEDEESMEESSVSSEEDETQEECVDHPSEEEQLFSKSLTRTQETRSDPDSVQNSEIEDSKDGDRKSRKGHGLKEAKKARVGKARFTRSSARLMSFEKEENPEELKSKVIRFNRFVSNIRFDPKI